MTQKSRLVILKFGSSVLRSEDDLPKAVHEIYRHWRDGAQVIAVASAFGNTTDQLMQRAKKVCEHPDESVLPSLLATGEAVASSLLTLALKKVGIPVRLLDEIQAQLRTVGGHTDATPVEVDAARLIDESRRAVVIIPGFVGRDENGESALLGRGGSDLTALFLAHQLEAQCLLVKDVDGLYTSDPAGGLANASRFAEASYETALRLGSQVVQTKALRFAADKKVRFTISSVGSQSQTEVGPFGDRLDGSAFSSPPLRVTLLGCGTVGGGVYQRLAELPTLFEVVGVGSRTSKRALATGVPARLATTDIEELLERDCDVVVELIGTTEYAASLATTALTSRRHFVTANKALLAVEGDRLCSLASDYNVTVSYSAAVGGALPALEAVARARRFGPIESISGVLNGTTNFLIDRIVAGGSFKEAIAEAQRSGYAEANASLDLNGTDAARKLVLLASKAFGKQITFTEIERAGIDEADVEFVRDAHRRGCAVRLVAKCSESDSGLTASVKLTELPPGHPLARVTGVENGLIIEPKHGEPVSIYGVGAGRWPTTEAVMADLFDLKRKQLVDRVEECEPLEVCA
jgi:homoserine dehydrogenase